MLEGWRTWAGVVLLAQARFAGWACTSVLPRSAAAGDQRRDPLRQPPTLNDGIVLHDVARCCVTLVFYTNKGIDTWQT